MHDSQTRHSAIVLVTQIATRMLGLGAILVMAAVHRAAGDEPAGPATVRLEVDGSYIADSRYGAYGMVPGWFPIRRVILPFRSLARSFLGHAGARLVRGDDAEAVLHVGLIGGARLHVNSYFYGFSSEQIGIFMLVIFLALLPSSWLAMFTSHRFGKRNAIVTFVVLEAMVHPIASKRASAERWIVPLVRHHREDSEGTRLVA